MSTTLNKPTWTRLVRYIPQGGDVNGYRLGEPVSDTVDVGRSLYERPNEPILVHRFTGTSLLEPGERTGEQDTIGQVLSPVTPDQVGTIRCIGLNYQKHAVEANMPIPTEPVVFFKPASALTGSFPAPVIVPKFVVNDKDSADYESELAIVLSKEAKDVDEQDAMSYVLGYCAANDISSRQRQFATSQWCFSKSFDTACPLGKRGSRSLTQIRVHRPDADACHFLLDMVGPTVVAAHAIPDYTKLRMRGLKNGRVMQETGLE